MAKGLCIGWLLIWAATLHASPSNEQLDAFVRRAIQPLLKAAG